MHTHKPSGGHGPRTPNGGGAPSQRSHRGSRGGRNRTTPSRYSRGSGETMNTDDVGDIIIVSGTDTSDTPEAHDTNRSSGSFARPEYAQSAGRSPRGASRSSGRGPARGGSRDNSRFNSRDNSFSRTSDRGQRTEQGSARLSRAWSPERDRSSRGGRIHGGSRAGSGARGGRGGGRGGGRRFSAPDLDIERFIEKSTRENADHKARTLAEPVHVVTNDFASLITHPKLREQVLKKGYTIPTPIQDQAIPHVYLKKDLVGIANTGTGKTAAFLIPLIDRALIHEHEKTLIVVPTRELATQIHDEFLGFSRGLGMSAAVVIGGVNIRPQISAVRNARFVIGTPGRLKDLIERRSLDMKSFTAIVLDEADRMLDMGFIPDIRFLMERMHHERHSLCFSATMPPEIEKLVNEFLKSPISVSTRTSTTSHAVDQSVVRITEGSSKMGLLEELLRDPSFDKVIVFGATKHGVERLTKQLSARGIRAESIHGNKSSNQRKRALDAFKLGRTRVLVATDVAARGLDISDVSHVINFDVPNSYDDYVHRIGRTGRAGKVGKAVTFVEGNR